MGDWHTAESLSFEGPIAACMRRQVMDRKHLSWPMYEAIIAMISLGRSVMGMASLVIMSILLLRGDHPLILRLCDQYRVSKNAIATSSS